MADNTVEIDVVLTGTEEAVEGFESIGETSAAMAERFEKDNSKLGEGLGSLTGNVTEMVGSVKGLGQAFKMSGTSMIGMLPAIGAVVAAGYALYETFLNISGAAEEAERAEENMAAAASDLQSKLEALAEKGVIPTGEELQKFTEMTIKAQFAKDQLETSMTNKVTPAMEKYNDLLSEQRKHQQAVAKETFTTNTAYLEATRRLPQLDKELAKARAKLTEKLKGYRAEQHQVETDIKAAAKQEQEFEERSTEARLALIKENKARLDALRLMSQETTEAEEQVKAFASLQKEKRALFDLELKRAEDDDNEEYIKDLNDRLKAELKNLNQRSIIKKRGVKDREDIREAASQKREAEEEKERSKRMARAAAYQAKRAAIERQNQAELKTIRELGYQQLSLEGVEVQDLLEMRYQDELKQAENNQNLRLIAEMRYQNALTKIQTDKEKQDEQLRLQDEQAEQDQQQRLAKQRQSFIESTMAFDAQRIEDQTTRELALLDIRYQKEFGLAEYTQEQITELQRRQALERQDILDQSLNASIEKMKGMAEDLAKTSTSAIYQSLVDAGQFDLQFEELKYSLEENVGRAREEMINAQASNDIQLVRQKEEEITNITRDYETQRQQIRAQQSQAMPLMFGQILKGLGQEAAVESMMETAKGISTLFTAPVLAGNHFAAAGVFAGAAALAGAAGAGLTNSANTAISRAGRGGGGGGALSPLGSPQTAPSPQREEAETSSMVFNINFGGAVIYDTQRAAEQAMADRITTLQNTRRRGAPRRSF